LRHDRGQDGFVSGVGEAVVADDEDGHERSTITKGGRRPNPNGFPQNKGSW
jgi:hypothetical protein